MTTDPSAEALADYLRTAKVLEVLPLTGGGGHGRKRTVIFEGGVAAVAKYGDPASIDAGPSLQVRAEVSAWTLASELGWTDLVPATVLRSLPDIDDPSLEVEASIQVLAARFETSLEGNFTAADIDPEAMRRCAVFDVLAANTDRSNANWGRILGSGRPVLIDHGHAFEATGGAVEGGDFITQALGDDLDDAIVASVEEFAANGSNSGLTALIGSEKASRLFERASAIVQAAAVHVP